MIIAQVLHAVAMLRERSRALVADDDTFVLIGKLPESVLEAAWTRQAKSLRIEVGRPGDLQRVLKAAPSPAAAALMEKHWPSAQGIQLPLRPKLAGLLPETAEIALHQSSQPAMQELLLRWHAPLIALPLYGPNGEALKSLAAAADALPRQAFSAGIAYNVGFTESLPPISP